MKKAWRVYKVLADGKRKCISWSFNEQAAINLASVTYMLHIPDTVRIELLCPDGSIRTKEYPKVTEEAMTTAEERLSKLPATIRQELMRFRARQVFKTFGDTMQKEG